MRWQWCVCAAGLLLLLLLGFGSAAADAAPLDPGGGGRGEQAALQPVAAAAATSLSQQRRSESSRRSSLEALQREIEAVLLEAEADSQAEAEAETEAESQAGFTLTAAQLQKAAGCSAALAQTYVGPINAAASKFAINTPKRMAGFLAQIGHESGSFRTLSENLNYSEAALKKTFPKYFNAGNAKSYARQPQKIASRAYANRMGNGNEASGDGWKFRGRGLIQITGKENYTKCGKALGLNLLANPDLLTQPMNAALSAGWFWSWRKINVKADAGDITAMSKLINGGTNGLGDRRKRYTQAKAALGVR